jgi:hypothetical protein
MFAEFPNTKFISETPNRCKNAKESIGWVAPWICETVETILVSYQSTWIKGAKAKGIIVKYPSGLRIGREQNLEPTIKQESFDLVCSNPPTDSVRGFQDLKVKSTLMESKSTTQASQASPNDQDIRIRTHSSSPLPR